MKCRCPECGGHGEVPCGNCNGNGYLPESIETAKLDEKSEAYPALRQLQLDAKKVREQAKEMGRLIPTYAGKFEAQATEVIDALDKEADAIKKHARGYGA